MTGNTASAVRVPAALLAVGVLPLVAGALRLLEIAGGPQVLPANARIADSPFPLVVHVVAAAVYLVAGAFQFPARIRGAHPAWHRRAGRVLAVAALLVAGSGLWMTLFYAGAPGGHLLRAFRLVAGSALAVSVVLGVTAIRRGDVRAHRAWMIRAYALAAAAGTQTLTQGVGEGVFGTTEIVTALSVGAGWVVNAVVAEWIIRRPVTRRRIRTAAGARS